jgi:hypothetical protein
MWLHLRAIVYSTIQTRGHYSDPTTPVCNVLKRGMTPRSCSRNGSRSSPTPRPDPESSCFRGSHYDNPDSVNSACRSVCLGSPMIYVFGLMSCSISRVRSHAIFASCTSRAFYDVSTHSPLVCTFGISYEPVCIEYMRVILVLKILVPRGPRARAIVVTFLESTCVTRHVYFQIHVDSATFIGRFRAEI